METRDVNDFVEALNEAEPGEIVYLTLVSNGQRKQLQVQLSRRMEVLPPLVPDQVANECDSDVSLKVTEKESGRHAVCG
jgi:hypothetical protein